MLFLAKVYAAILDACDDLPLVFRGLILGPVTLIVAISIYQWHDREYPSRPPVDVNVQRIQHPNYHHIASRALSKFAALTSSEQTRLIQNLEENIWSVEQWLVYLDKSNYQLLCLGESHLESTRKFLSEVIFTKHNFAALFLEVTEQQLREINRRLSSDSVYYPLLDADILQLLRSVKNNNPNVRIYGIEANHRQISSQGKSQKSRDDLITDNFWNNYVSNARNIVLIGAMHCSDSAFWFYSKMKNTVKKNNLQRINNVRIISEHEEGPVEALVYFLDDIGFNRDDFVIINTKKLAPEIREWFSLTSKLTLDPYQTVIIYRPSESIND